MGVIKNIKKVFKSDIENKKDELREVFFSNAKQCKAMAEKIYARTIGKPFTYRDLALLFQEDKMSTMGAELAVKRLSEFFFVKLAHETRNEFLIVLDPTERIKMIKEYNRAKQESLEFAIENNNSLIQELETELAKVN
jgi:hypothetical protein